MTSSAPPPEDPVTRAWRRVETLLLALSTLTLGALVGLPFLQVILRDFFAAPIVGLEEGTRWGLIALVFLALPLLIATNGQIRFSEVVDRLPRSLRRGLERLIMALAAFALGVVVVAGIGSVAMNSGTRTPTLDIPFWLFALPFLAGSALAAAGYLWFALRPAPPPTEIPPPVL